MTLSLRHLLIPTLLVVSMATFFNSTHVANAQDPTDFAAGIKKALSVDENGLSKKTPTEILQTIINYILGLVSLFAVAMLIAGGIMVLTSAGAEEKTKKGKTLILYAIIGLLIIGVSAIAVNIVINVIFA